MKNTLQKNIIITTSFAAIALASAANAQAAWENVAVADGLTPVTINGATLPADAVWVPNQFNNPVIGPTGIVTFRGQLAGTGLQTTAPNNTHIFVTGSTGGAGLTQIARAGNALPSGLAAGLVCNTTTGSNGLGTTQFQCANGGTLITGNLNGAGVTTTTSPFWMWRDSTGTNNYIIYRGGDAYPGATGVTISVSAGSPQYVNNDGNALVSATLAGTGVVTAAGVTQNNAAVMWMGPSGKSVVIRKGDAAPGFTDGTVFQPDTFGLQCNGNGVILSGKLAAVSGITTSNDTVYLTNAWGNGLEIFARKGSPIPGYPTLNFQSLTTATTAPITFAQHPLMDDGSIVFRSSLGGSGATLAINDSATFSAKNGVFTILLRKGDTVPGISGVVFSSTGSGSVMNNNGMYAYEGILMNADGTSITDTTVGASFLGVRKADGTIVAIARQFDPVPGIAGATFAALAGSSSVCISDSGVVVFSNSFNLGTSNNTAICAWDAASGLRVIAKSGDTNFTGTPCNQITLIGGTGVTGNGINSALNAAGQLVLRVGDSVNSINTIAKINLAPVIACAADINGDHQVDGSDLAVVLSQWGTAGSADINHDGNVDGQDLATLLGAWGTCP
jgi:hypothetical protein